MEDFISRWKLNRKNLLAMCEILWMNGDEISFLIEKCEQGVIPDFVANETVEIIEARLDEVETRVKALAVRLISDYCKQVMKTGAGGVPYMTPKILGIDRLYQDENGTGGKWFLFYYLFNLDREQSTLVGELDEDKRAEF